MFNKERTAATYAKIILRSYSGNELAENAVADGRMVPLNGDLRRILEAGTVMMWMGAPYASKVRPVPATGGSAGTDEVQTVTRSATPDAGSYNVEVPGYGTTPNLTDYSAAALQTAIRALHADLSAATVGLVGQVYTITFVDYDAAPVVVTANNLTSSGVPVTFTVATTTQGELNAADIAGIVMHTVELWPDATEALKDDEPIALYTKNCAFETSQLIGYSGNAALVKAAMSGAGNQRCANCTFEP
jgi:hypothetical protein